MAIQVYFHRLAVQEYLAAQRWYNQRSTGVLLRFTSAVDQAIGRIVVNPLVGPTFRSVFRWVRVERFPYLLFYALLPAGDVRILAVAHASRRPGFCLRRATSP
jgi:plasmid stabilization system protein ParE